MPSRVALFIALFKKRYCFLTVFLRISGDRGFNEEIQFYLNNLEEMNYDLTSTDDEKMYSDVIYVISIYIIDFFF